MKPRYFYGGFLIIVIVVGVTIFSYRTLLPARVSQTVDFGGVSLRIEYATTSAAQERGLGGRTSIPDDYGMLFVFPKDDFYGFWMKNTLVPLDIFWLDSNGHVVSIAMDIATSTYPNVFYPTAPARYVLETASGFARANFIATGTLLQLKNFPSVTK